MTMWILQVISFCWAPVSSPTKWRGLVSGSYETPQSNGGESGTRSRLLLPSPGASRNLVGPFLRSTGGARRAGETRKALAVTRTRTHSRTHVRGRQGLKLAPGLAPHPCQRLAHSAGWAAVAAAAAAVGARALRVLGPRRVCGARPATLLSHLSLRAAF